MLLKNQRVEICKSSPDLAIIPQTDLSVGVLTVLLGEGLVRQLPGSVFDDSYTVLATFAKTAGELPGSCQGVPASKLGSQRPKSASGSASGSAAAAAAADADAGPDADPDADPDVDPDADPEADPDGDFGRL